MPTAAVRLELLGRVEAHRGRRSVSRFRTHKTAALLGYLALGLDRPHPREVLVDLFWPDADPASGRGSLSASLSSLRAQLDPTRGSSSVFLATRHDIALNPEVVGVDVADLETALDAASAIADEDDRRARLTDALRLYRGPFMPAHYDDWVLRERDRLAERVFDALEELIRLTLRAGDAAEAVTLARRGLATDPLRESGHRLLIRALLAGGKDGDARKQLESLRAMLRREFDADPEPATLALFDAGAAAETRSPVRARRDTPPKPKPARAAAPSPPPSRLPRPLTSFVGRESELREVALWLDDGDTRLITLVGLGGSGKSRIAIEAARRHEVEHSDVWWVPLADVDRPGLVPDAIADSIDAPRAPGEPALAAIEAALAERGAVLVLDNAEHLLPDAAAVVVDVLAAVPTLTLLVTSRRPLDVSAERTIAVGPMPLPDADAEHVDEVDSVVLFTERASFVAPGFRLGERNAASVARICRRVSGLPLGIELAAARMQVMSPSRLLHQLERRLDALKTGRADVADRHRSLDATLKWSIGLLPKDVRAFLEAMSVLAGWWDLETAEGVSGDPLALDHLSLLHEFSLVRIRDRDGEPRFDMLDVVKTHVAARLGPRRRRALENAYVDHFVARGETLFSAPPSDTTFDLVGTVMTDQEHYRRVVDLLTARARKPGRESHAALRDALLLAARIGGPWAIRGRIVESRDRLAGLLSIRKWTEPTRVRGMALSRLAEAHYFLGDIDAAEPVCDRAVAMLREVGDTRALPAALHWRAEIHHLRGEDAGMRAALTESLSIFRAAKEWQGVANISNALASRALSRGELDEAEAHYLTSVEVGRDHGHPANVALGLTGLADIARRRGDLAGAHDLLDQAEACIAEHGAGVLDLDVLVARTKVFRDDGEAHSAAAHAALAFDVAAARGNDAMCAWSLGELAASITATDAARAELIRGASLRFGASPPAPVKGEEASRHSGTALDAAELAAVVARFRPSSTPRKN